MDLSGIPDGKRGKSLGRPREVVRKGIQSVRFESGKEPLFIQLDPDDRVPRMTDDRLTWEKKTDSRETSFRGPSP
jgi:hypothetical protein